MQRVAFVWLMRSKTAPEQAVVIRSHGVVPEVLDALAARGNEIIDATCPHVMRAQRAAAKLAAEGYHVLVVGEEGHPEVEGILAHARREGDQCMVVGAVEDIPEDLNEPVGIVVQTTPPTKSSPRSSVRFRHGASSRW